MIHGPLRDANTIWSLVKQLLGPIFTQLSIFVPNVNPCAGNGILHPYAGNGGGVNYPPEHCKL